MKNYNVLMAVVDVIPAKDAEDAISRLKASLLAAGFTPYEGTYDLVPDGYRLAYESEDQEDCDAEVRHGPGHQSRTQCELKGAHDVHRAIYMGNEATWSGPVAYTGAFDEPPTAD